MSLKPKTSRRLLILLAVVLLAGLGAGGLFVLRRVRHSHDTTAKRAEGLRLAGEKHYYEALAPLKKVLEQTPDDREALKAYATSRENVEERDGGHIAQAASIYQKLHTLDRADRETSLHLLNLLATAQMNTETISLAQELRPADLAQCTADHLPILRAEGAARTRSKARDDKAGEVLGRIIALDPEDFGTRVVYAEWLRDQGWRDQALALARGFSEKHGADPRARLLTAMARQGEPGFDSRAEVFAALCEMNALDPDTAGPVGKPAYADPLDVLRSATLFDNLAAHAHSLAVLNEGAKQVSDPVVKRLLVRRLWMAGRPADAVVQTQNPDLGPAGTNTELLIFRALSLNDTGDREGARKVVDAINVRQGDYRIGAWKPAFRVLLQDPAPSPDDAITSLTEAFKKAPGEPVIASLLGDAYQRAGRVTDAREQWKKAALMPMATGWTRPWLGQAYSYLAEGRPQSALPAAQAAARIAPRSMSTYLCLFRVNVALLLGGFEPAMSATPAALLETTDRVDAELALTDARDVADFRANVFPGRVLLASRTKGKDAGRKTLDEGLKNFPALSVPLIQELMDISAREGLGAEPQLLARFEASGASDAQPAFAAARAKLRQDDLAGGLAILTAGLDKAQGASKTEWRMAIASLYDAADKREDAKRAWKEAVTNAPNDLQAHLAALASPSVYPDKALVDQLIARAITLGGYEPSRLPAPLQLARARSLLSEPVTEAGRNTALDTLRTLISAEPDWVEARLLMVTGLTMNKPEANIRPIANEAAEQIRALTPLVPNPAALNLMLAKLHADRGDLASAKAQLDAIASSATASAEARLTAVDLLISYRELQGAASALERMDAAGAGDKALDVRVRLASVYRSLSRDRESLALLKELATQPLGTQQYVVAVASDLATLNQKDQARAVLKQLETLTLEPGDREAALAQYESRFGSQDQTIALLRRACDLAPTNADYWARLVSYLNENGKTEQAREALSAAKAKLPTHPRIAVLEKQFALAQSVQSGGKMDLEEVARVLDAQPEMKLRAQGVRDIAAARAANRLSDGAEVDRLSQKYAAEPMIQTLLGQTLVQASPPQTGKALDVMRKALRDHPRSIEVASWASTLFRATQNWTDMLAAARAWQELTRDREADLAVGEALLSLDRADTALESLRPHVELARSQPDDPFSLRTLDLAARAHLRAGRPADALSLLAPLLDSSARLRTDVFLPLAGQNTPDEATANAWIAAVGSKLNATSPDDQIALAGTHATLARRFPEAASQHLAAAAALVAPFASKADATAGIHDAMGTIQVMQGQHDAATASFRKAIAANPKHVNALRSLSNLVGAKNPSEAVQLAERALAETGPADPQSQESLARACMALGQTQPTADAQASFKRAADAYAVITSVQPSNVPAMLGAITALDSAGKVSDTLPYYERLIGVPQLPAGLTRASIQNNFADALVRSGRSGDELVRARAMAREATQSDQVGAYYDTLGMVEAALRKHDESVAAFRQAMKLDPTLLSSAVGLAEQLSQGSPAERTEAKAILDGLDANNSLPQTLRERARRIRAELR
ncbi:MAG: hypothetical protein U0637_04780 [Phycisphaerales bacterium]